MAIPPDTASTERLLKYARYHVATLKANAQTQSLAEAVELKTAALRQRHAAREAAEEAVIARTALLNRTDFRADNVCRACELDTLAAVEKNRAHSDYRAAFPLGLTGLVAARGEAQSRQMLTLAETLASRLPEVATKHGALLTELGQASLDAEMSLKQARSAEGQARNEENIARAELVRQLHANRGGLRVLFPRQPKQVSSYFPPSRQRDAGEDDDVEDEAEVSGQLSAAGVAG